MVIFLMQQVQPRTSDSLLHTEDILAAIDENKGRLALVLLGGVNYLTGQVLDMATLSAHMVALNAENKQAGRPAIPFGLDLAHAIGNVRRQTLLLSGRSLLLLRRWPRFTGPAQAARVEGRLRRLVHVQVPQPGSSYLVAR